MSRIVRFHKTGDADVLKIEEVPLQNPAPGELRITVEAIGLNRAEIMFRNGMYLANPTFPSKIGYEASGTVDAIGPDVTGFKLGDRVSSIPAFSMSEYGVYGETAIVPARFVAHYPSNLNVNQATSIWMQYLTAWGGLIHHGKLQSGQSVLITAGGSSVALAAVQTARVVGAKPIVTTRTSAKKKPLKDAGAAEVIATQEEDIVARVNEITGGKGVSLVFDPIGGPILAQLAYATARGGQIIEYGALSTEPTPYPLFAALAKGLVIRGYTLFEVTAPWNTDVLARGVSFVTEQLKNGTFVPLIDKVFPFDKIADAHRYMESNEQIGKIVVTVP
ncbi:MAG TPA: zinc-dependent alcohol dehydrogenase family protein [Candidatus Acidoferrum sp.]|jgi:NADPH:quinone reductase-like Zn-dependent oxidoreductase